MENSNEIRKFFKSLYGPDLHDLYLEIFKLPGAHQIWCASIEEAVEAADDEKHDVFFGVGLRWDKKGDEDHVALIPALWVDMDWKDFEGGKKEALEKVIAYEHKPSIILESGHGFHLYFLLKEPLEVTPENRSYIRSQLRGLAEDLNGDLQCCDLARKMRVPGTLNWKEERNG